MKIQSQPGATQLILFRASGLRLGIDTREVQEVTRAIPLSVPLPNAGAVLGLITLRGQSTAVIDLARVLGLPGEHDAQNAKMIAVKHNGTIACLLVDRLEGLHEVTAAARQPPPTVSPDVDIHWLDHVTRLPGGELIGVISAERILALVSPASAVAEKACA